MQFVFCTQLFTEKHVHITTPDYVMTLILFKFLWCSFYDKKKKEYRNMCKCSKDLNTLFFLLLLLLFFVVVVFFCFVFFFFLLLLLFLFFFNTMLIRPAFLY